MNAGKSSDLVTIFWMKEKPALGRFLLLSKVALESYFQFADPKGSLTVVLPPIQLDEMHCSN
jgi:hypothetical protein